MRVIICDNDCLDSPTFPRFQLYKATSPLVTQATSQRQRTSVTEYQFRMQPCAERRDPLGIEQYITVQTCWKCGSNNNSFCINPNCSLVVDAKEIFGPHASSSAYNSVSTSPTRTYTTKEGPDDTLQTPSGISVGMLAVKANHPTAHLDLRIIGCMRTPSSALIVIISPSFVPVFSVGNQSG